MAEVYGNGQECYAAGPAGLAISDTAAHVLGKQPTDMRHMDKIGGQFVTDVGVTPAVDGAWKVEVSNDFVPDGSSSYGASSAAGTWTDVTALFLPALVAVAHGTAATRNQFSQAEVRCRAVRFTFTATAGTGNANVIINAKGRG